MKPLFAVILLGVAGISAAADISTGTLLDNKSPHPFDISDLVMLERVSDPQLSPDGRYAAFSVRSTDYAANKGINALYLQDLDTPSNKPIKVVAKQASSPR